MLIHELHIWSYQAIQFCSKEFRILSTFEAIELYEEYWHVRFSSCGNICWVCKCGCWSSSKYRFPVICNSLKTKTPPWKITHIRVECECHTVYFCVYISVYRSIGNEKWKTRRLSSGNIVSVQLHTLLTYTLTGTPTQSILTYIAKCCLSNRSQRVFFPLNEVKYLRYKFESTLVSVLFLQQTNRSTQSK